VWSLGRGAHFALLCSCCLWLIGCRDARPSELPGRYVLATAVGQATIVLGPNQRMDQEVRPRAGPVKQISGHWRFEGGFLILDPCLTVDPQMKAKQVGFCAYGVEVPILGQVHISADSVRDLSYRRISAR
jgi:hypothetical protein